MSKAKKWLALLMAVCMVVPNVSGLVSDNVGIVQAEEETAKTWSDWVETLSENAEVAVSLDAANQVFDGTRVEDVSAQYADSIKTVETGSIILRFKANSTASTGVILGTRNSAATLPSNIKNKDSNASAMMLTDAGKFRFVYSYDGAEIAGPHLFTDGNWHTVVLSGASTGKNIRITIDGVEKWSISNRADLAGMFSRQSVIDTVTIGGHKNGNSVVGGFNGSISDVIVTSEAISDDDAIAISAAGYSGDVELGTAIADTMLNVNLRDNTWLFTGGETVQGGFSQTRGIRNYIGQFEEYVRWTVANSPINGRQRFTFNTAKTGQTLKDVVENFEDIVATFKTKAVVYMVGAEDYNQGEAKVADFKTALNSFISKSLALKANQAFVIIQKPFAVNDATANANIEKYCAAVDAVIDGYKGDSEKAARILVVDHYTSTKDNADFKATKLENDKLNAKGHLEISRQFAEKVVNYTGGGYPKSNVVLDRVELEQPDEYLAAQPTATATENSLSVAIPAVEGVTSWKYELDMDGTVVSGTADENQFEVTGLTAGKDYVLKIQSADGEKQLVTVKGTLSNGNVSKKNVQENLDANQQKIAALVAGEEPVTWLFMGDSITHASGLTYGYDGIAQVFEKFVKEGLGRNNDIVLNTAVANANTKTTIQEIDQRLTNYSPDVISLMIGTNDCSATVTDITLNVFEENMKIILDTMKTNYPEAVIILRSMVPFFNDGNREPNREAYMNVVKEMAEKYGTIYVDQYTALAEATSTYTWLPRNMFTDNLHPEANGHRVMTNMFIKACGLWTEDLPMTNLFYSMGIVEESNAAVPTVITGPDQIGVSVGGLEVASSLSFGDVVLKATSKTSSQTYEVSVKDGANYVVLNNLPGNTTYTVEVSGHLTTAAKNVTFAAQEVTLSDDAEPAIEVFLSSKKAKDLTAGAAVGTLSVDGLVAEGTYTFELCEGTGSKNNDLFTISDNQLKTAAALEAGNSYSIRVKAVNGTSVKEAIFEITAVGKQLIFEKEDMTVASGSPVDLTSESYASKLFDLEEGTIVVNYVSSSTYGVQSLFSIANGTTGNNDRHFHVYITPNGRLGCEIRDAGNMNYHIYKDGAVVAGAENIIALKADAETGEYKLFANGELVYTLSASTLGGFKFADDVTNADTIQIGATKRGGSAAYSFAGTVNSIQVYGTALDDAEIIKLTNGEEPETPEIPDDSEEPTIEVSEDLLKAGSISVTEDSVTENQPFAANTAGSNLFRIPALITLDNGDLLAVADARWQTSADWGGLDTIASVSSDNGKTWQYSFPIFFPDSNLSTGAKQSTTIIDPVIVQGNDGTIYCVVDVNPTSITTGDIMPAPEIGFVEINGVQRLVLTDTYTQPTSKNWATYGNPEDYEYYVGDFNEDGFAKVFKKADNRATDWIVDEWYNIYKLDKTANAYKPLTQTQVNSDTVIQQNAYYAGSELHVYNTGYLWLVKSTDNGRSWSAPTILNTQIKREGEVALLASPGQGMVASNGDIIIPFYDHGDSQENASIIWSSDNGKTWTRSNDISGMWSSENEVVELYDGVLRMFFRNGNNVICYADITKENGVWTMGQGVRTSIPVRSGCNVTAINCSETIDGKKVVMVACPSDPNGRNDGNIYTFLINEDNTMELYNIFSVNKGAYAYSCMTEMANGNIGLLWEPAAAAIRFDEFELDVVLGHKKIVTVDAGDVWVEETVADKAKEITTEPDETIATVTSEFVVEDTVTALHNFGTSAAGVKDSFQAEADVTKKLSDAEFTFTKNGDKWQLKNGTKYVVLSSSDSYFGNSAADVTVAMNETNGTVRIYNNDNRYMLFLKSTSTANYNYYDAYKTTTPDSAESSDARLEFDLVLLEAKGDSNAAEVAPGYVRATSVQDGKNYIIAYIDGDAVAVLYPTNGKTAQTKLVGETVEIAKNVVTITGVKPGTTSAVIDEILYSIVVEDPTIRADYAGNDYPVDKLTATAGAAQNGTTEGPAELALDEDPLTHFHSAWSPKCTDDQLWLTVELKEAQDVTGVRYLPRNGAGNGTVTAYEIFCSMDGEHWTSVTTGNWELNGEWKIARFDEAVEAKYVKLFAVDSTGDKNGRHMSAAEVRVTVAPEVPEIPEEPKAEVCTVFTDVAHGAWYEDEVQYVYDKGIMTGVSDTTFEPETAVTRATIVQTLYKLEGKPAVSDFTKYDSLNDTLDSIWWRNGLAWALNEGVAKGDSHNNVFNPDNEVTREDLATFIYRYAQYKGINVELEGTVDGILGDTFVNSWAKTAFAWAIETGLIKGKTINGVSDLAPQVGATRAELATIMMRFYQNNQL